MATWGVKIGTYNIGTEAAIEAIKVIKSRRVSQYPVIRQDLTLIPEGCAQPMQIELRGTIAGSDYTSLRTELEQINNALAGGRQPFYIDNERYVNVLDTTFDYSFITQDFCNYSVRFIGQLPYFLAAVASSNVSTPTSGSSYAITNVGNVRVPLKIVIRPVASGTVSDNIQIENHTLSQLFKYRGVVSATEDVAVDTGYDNENIPSYSVDHEGVTAMSAFEGDFLWLNDGVNYIEFTGIANVTVSLYWREGYRA